MPKVKTTIPQMSRNKGEKNVQDDPLYFSRILPAWQQPEWYSGEMWRAIVAQQPIAKICRDTMISNMVALNWCIEPRDSNLRDELKPEIDYYTKFFEYDGQFDYTERTEMILQDYFDLPFGGAFELGREGDNQEGRLIWVEPLDGATLFPTLNYDYPVGQQISIQTVYFPYHAINRMYMSPRNEFRRRGWGTCPPEKIFLALSLLNRGDVYYANLLLDTPQVGILDLQDMSKESAAKWVESWKTLLSGIDPFKIPVLYEHEKPAQFIPFGRSPTELMFDTAIGKYASIVTAGYGMTLSDIGVPTGGNGGDTLAGSIRQERHTRKTGYALTKKKLNYFNNRMLPPELVFKFIDIDDELSVAMGRARLANATAIQLLVQQRVLTPNEGRMQLISDGLINISIPEKVEGGDEFPVDNAQNTQERPGLLGKPVAPSQGGYGEQRSATIDAILDNNVNLDYDEKN